MSEITPEKTHRLLEKLVEHVMNNVPTKDEVPSNVQFQYLTGKVCSLEDKVNSIEVKTDVLEKKVDNLLDGIDKQTQQLDIIRTEQIACDHDAFNRIEKRVEKLERTH